MSLNHSLNNKRILFFSQYFFGYEKKIKEKMEEMGARVDMYDERSVTSSLDRALIKFFPKFFINKTRKYFQEILNEKRGVEYDYILFIDCEMASKEDIVSIKEMYTSAKLCLYMWDSLSNLKGVEEKIQLFDYVTTFDRNDSDRLSIKFRPLFYCDDYCKDYSTENFLYGTAFIGTIHSDRLSIIKKIQKQLSDNQKIYIYPYLQSKWVYWIYKLIKKEFWKTKLSDFKFEKISSSEIVNITAQTLAIIDIQHPNQTGLTMRTLEMIGMKKKIITTNKDIINYDFYNPNNILVIDRKNPIVNINFFKSEYQEISQEILQRYYIENWIMEVLGVDG